MPVFSPALSSVGSRTSESAGCVALCMERVASQGWLLVTRGHSAFLSVDLILRKVEFTFSLNVNSNYGRCFVCACYFEISSEYILFLVCMFFSLVSASPWADAFSSNSPIYQSDVTNERNRSYVQCHGARTESLPLAPRPAHNHHGRVCKGTFLRLESRVVYMHFHWYYNVLVIYTMEIHQNVFPEIFTWFYRAFHENNSWKSFGLKIR